MGSTSPFLIHMHELDGGDLVFAFRLDRIYFKERDALEGSDVAAVSHRREHTDFLTAVHRTGSPFSLAYRIVTKPSAESFVRGEVTIGFLVRFSGRKTRKSMENAVRLASDLLALMNGVFTHHEFVPVRGRREFQSFWKPFPLRHVAEIRRREDRFAPSSRIPVWKTWDSEDSGTEDTERAERDSMYFVYPFVPTDRSLERLLSYLLMQSQPCLIDVLLEPTQLRTEEEALFVQTLQVLDRLSMQVTETAPTVPSGLSRTVASFLSRALLSQYRGLLDAPFLVRVAVASPKPLESHLVHAIGVEFIEPAGGTSEVPGHYEDLLAGQTGGFDVVRPGDRETKAALVASLREVRFHPWGFNLARKDEEERLRFLFDPVEATSVFRLPSPFVHSMPGLRVKLTKVLPLPREAVSEAGAEGKDSVVIGVNEVLGSSEPVCLERRDRREHVYIVGQTGTGKSSLIYRMILHDLRNGDGLGLIDPHGDLFRLVLRSIPRERAEDVVVLDPTDTEYPFALNPLECADDYQRDFVIQEMIAIARRIYDPQGQGQIVGPVFEDTVRAALMAVMMVVEEPTFAHFLACLANGSFRAHIRSELSRLPDPAAELTRMNLENLDKLRELGDMVRYVASKYGRLLSDKLLRNITLQGRSAIDLREIIDEGRILLVNLNRARIGLLTAEWLGMLLMMRLELAAMQRVDMAPSKRKDFFLYVDEFQNVASASFPQMLGEARKFRLNLTLAHQYFTQVPLSVRESILGNVGTVIAFRLGGTDAEKLSGLFRPLLSSHDLTNQPNFEASVSMVRASERVRPFTVRTFPPEPPDQACDPEYLIRLSRRKYTRPRLQVEFEILNSLQKIRGITED